MDLEKAAAEQIGSPPDAEHDHPAAGVQLTCRFSDEPQGARYPLVGRIVRENCGGERAEPRARLCDDASVRGGVVHAFAAALGLEALDAFAE